MDCDVFDRVEIYQVVTGGSTITWSLRPSFKEAGPYNFYVDWARPGGDWTVVNEIPVVNMCSLVIDPEQHNWNKEFDVYYRVRLIMPDGTIYYSQPQHASGNLDRHDWLIARDIIRKEYLRLTKYVGRRGWLLKRRNWGTMCNACRDFDTKQIVNSSCPHCFGTGRLYGYFPGIEYWIEELQHTPRRRYLDQEVNTRNDITIYCRSIAYPFLTSYDVWVDDDTDERYYIHRINPMASLRGVRLIVGPELRLAEPTHIVYTVPIEGVPISSSSEEPSSSSGTSSSGTETGTEESRAGIGYGGWY